MRTPAASLEQIARECAPLAAEDEQPTAASVFRALHQYIGRLMAGGQALDEAAFAAWWSLHGGAAGDRRTTHAAFKEAVTRSTKKGNTWAEILNQKPPPRLLELYGQDSPDCMRLALACRYFQTAKGPGSPFELARSTAANLIGRYRPNGQPDKTQASRTLKVLMDDKVIECVDRGLSNKDAKEAGKEPTRAKYLYLLDGEECSSF